MKTVSKILLFGAYCLSSATLVGCSSNNDIREAKPIRQEQANALPAWVLNPDMPNGIAAIGIAGAHPGNFQEQLPKARLEAKDKIAQTIQEKINYFTPDVLEDADIKGIGEVEHIFSKSAKEVTSADKLQDIKQINVWQNPDGTLYVHLILGGDDYLHYLKTSRSIYEQNLKQSKLTPVNLKKANGAVQDLFKRLELDRKGKKRKY